nr:hypothetical protein GCM10020063_033330 [Dactylosporangium thailandense]
MSGVATDAASSQAVSTHVTVPADVCRSRCMTGSTGLTSDCNIEKAAVDAARTPNVSRYEDRET